MRKRIKKALRHVCLDLLKAQAPLCEQHKMWIVRSRAMDLQNWLEMRENYLKHRREMDEMEKGLK
jgi:hypothetical protein